MEQMLKLCTLLKRAKPAFVEQPEQRFRLVHKFGALLVTCSRGPKGRRDAKVCTARSA